MLRVSISDNGLGLSEESLQELKKMLNEETLLSDHKIGLCNVNMRIRLSFGSQYGVSISSTEGKGTTVCLIMPRVMTEE